MVLHTFSYLCLHLFLLHGCQTKTGKTIPRHFHHCYCLPLSTRHPFPLPNAIRWRLYKPHLLYYFQMVAQEKANDRISLWSRVMDATLGTGLCNWILFCDCYNWWRGSDSYPCSWGWLLFLSFVSCRCSGNISIEINETVVPLCYHWSIHTFHNIKQHEWCDRC